MFVNEEYKNYKYLVDVSDNYVVLTDQRVVNGSWQEPESIDIIYQYFEPSTLVIESSQTFSNTRTFTQVDTSQNFYDRSDCHEILLSAFLIVLLTCFVINQVTEFIVKGGLFH